MQNQVIFSILMCNYNNANYISQAIDSVLKQSFENWELSIVDDCSTDNSMEIIKEYESIDSRIKVFLNSENSGYGKSLAKNIELATGKYGAILDPDDALTPQALQLMHDVFKKDNELVGAYSQMYYCDKDLKIEKIFEFTKKVPSNSTYLEHGRMAMTHFFVFDREKFIMHGNIDTRYRNALDQDWYYKIEEIGKVEFVNCPLYYYRVSPTGISQGIKKRYFTTKDHLEIAKNAINRRGITGRKKIKIISKIKALLFYTKYRFEKSEKNPQALLSLYKSKYHQIISKIYD
ncbi:glycosyltransferase family 2 protein [Halpernia sp.]|uniref:glycosyltransferase family 2 protein n=1 Tax=Halpernia sp. TaxID=2782209 RepID=UPI003A9532E4